MTELLHGLVEWLNHSRSPDGRILDPVHRQLGTYAEGLATVALAATAGLTSDGASAAASCARIAASRPAESEFDHFGLLLTHYMLVRLGIASERFGLPGASDIPVYTGGRLVSHNWRAMRAVNLTLRGALRTSPQSDWAESEAVWRGVLTHQEESGVFVDSPGGVATPTTYHAKFCAMLALTCWIRPETADWVREPLQRGLNILADCVSPGGVLLPFGRSRHSLFGYAAAILALAMGSKWFGAGSYRDAALRLRARLLAFQRQDGHVPCVLNDGEAQREDWDVYVNNPDYNAYAAALLTVADHFEETDNLPLPQPLGDGLRTSGSGWAILRQGGTYAAVTTQGQCVPRGAPFFCDPRYYGLQPLIIEVNERIGFLPPPFVWPGERRADLVDPAQNPALSWVEQGGERYACRTYSQFVLEATPDGFRAEGAGAPTVLRPVSTLVRRTHSLISLLRPHAGPLFSEHDLHGVTFRRQVSWVTSRSELRIHNQAARADGSAVPVPNSDLLYDGLR